MAGKRHDDRRLCRCGRADGSCAGLAVRRLSQDRVRELAEEIWTVSSADPLPARPAQVDPRSSRAGGSAQAAYWRRRDQEREDWRPALVWLVLVWGALGAAPAAGLLLGVTVGAWLGWPVALLVAVLAWSRLRFRPSAAARIWRRQAAMQRRTAGLLGPLADEGWLVLHDVTLPGWPDSLEHLVVGPTGVWVVQSWQRQRLLGRAAVPAGIWGRLRSQTHAVAEVLDGRATVPVRPLLCVYGRWSGGPRTFQGSRVAAPRRPPDAIRRRGSQQLPGEVERAATRLLEVLRPVA